MQKKYTSLGLMSGTSGDGVDASLIRSDGQSKFEVIKDKYFEYDQDIYNNIHKIKEKISNKNDLNKISKELSELERKITVFHAKVVKEFETSSQDFIIGFHGQTIYHNSKEKISKQLGDGKLLHQLSQKKIIFNFRKNDILNGGEGAPLAPIFHQLLVSQNEIKLPVCVLNIGGISNITIIKESKRTFEILSKDIGPGNCLIDSWVRKNSDKKFDYNGKLSLSGNTNEIIFEQAQELYLNRLNKDKQSYDVNDFDISFVRGLSLADGASTLTDFTANIIGESLILSLKLKNLNVENVLVCGGGRKNKILMNKIKNILHRNIKIELIDNYGINGDYVESQAFAFIAIRSLLNLPISFPSTTGCKKPCTGGELITN